MRVLWNEFSETKTSHLILSAKAPKVGRWSTYKILNYKWERIGLLFWEQKNQSTSIKGGGQLRTFTDLDYRAQWYFACMWKHLRESKLFLNAEDRQIMKVQMSNGCFKYFLGWTSDVNVVSPYHNHCVRWLLLQYEQELPEANHRARRSARGKT